LFLKKPRFRVAVFSVNIIYMSWASRRKSIFTGALALLVLVFLSIPLYSYLTRNPTCTDGKQNGDELGVDCGGSCDTLCPSQAREMIVHWSRAFEVGDGIVDALAYVENPNVLAGSENVIYRFKLYDENNILITEKFGKTFILPGEQIAVFEPALRTGERIPKYAFFEFAPDIQWVRVKKGQNVPELSISEQNITDLETKPRLSAVISNNSTIPASKVEVVVIIYDIDDNAIAVSSTLVEEIAKYSEKTISFSWRHPFDALPARIDIIPRINTLSISK